MESWERGYFENGFEEFFMAGVYHFQRPHEKPFCEECEILSSGVWHRWKNKIDIWSWVVLLLKFSFSTWESLLLCWCISGVPFQNPQAFMNII